MAGLKFRVLLDSEKNEEIFRDIFISDTDNFESFFKAIVSSFRFTGDEIASFYVSNDSWDKGHEINLMDMTYGDDDVDSLPSVMKDAIIKDFLEEPDQKFILVYDFMRMWIFLIELIGYDKNDPAAGPEVLLAMGMAPPEDSRIASEQLFAGEADEHDDEDDLGFDDFDDDISEDDFSNFDDYQY